MVICSNLLRIIHHCPARDIRLDIRPRAPFGIRPRAPRKSYDSTPLFICDTVLTLSSASLNFCFLCPWLDHRIPHYLPHFTLCLTSILSLLGTASVGDSLDNGLASRLAMQTQLAFTDSLMMVFI